MKVLYRWKVVSYALIIKTWIKKKVYIIYEA